MTISEYPHMGGCPGCRELRACNYCGGSLIVRGRCNNGRCIKCHGKQCTPGGITTPGHGYGIRSVICGRPHYDTSDDFATA